MHRIITARHAGEVPNRPPDHSHIDEQGYVKLRWRIAAGVWVECREHRYVAGFPDGAVRHINGDRADNRVENLEVVPHGGVRGRSRIDAGAAARLHADGLSWGEIGRRLGCTANGAKAAVRRFSR